MQNLYIPTKQSVKPGNLLFQCPGFCAPGKPLSHASILKRDDLRLAPSPNLDLLSGPFSGRPIFRLHLEMVLKKAVVSADTGYVQLVQPVQRQLLDIFTIVYSQSVR